MSITETFLEKSKAWQKCASFSRFTNLEKKISKKEKRRNVGKQQIRKT